MQSSKCFLFSFFFFFFFSNSPRRERNKVQGGREWGERSCWPTPVTISCMFDLMFFEKRVHRTSQCPCPVPIRWESVCVGGALNHKWHPASSGTIWESEPAREEQNVPCIHPFARRRRLHSRLLTIASNYPHFFFSSSSWWNGHGARLSCVSVRLRWWNRKKKKGGGAAKKRDSMCLSEWRWRVSVWLVNPV